MEALTYVLKVNLIFSILFLGYALVTRRTVFHQWNRFYLLLVPLVALLIPAIDVGASSEAIYVVELPQVVFADAPIESGGSRIGLATTLFWMWLLGCSIAFIGSIRNIAMSMRHDTSGAGHSFLGRIYVDRSLDHETQEKIEIHERVHAEQWHTLDLLWYELLRVVFWFNPLFLFGRRSLKELHEYIADSVANKYCADYGETLVATAFGLSTLPLANEFNSINIKNRIKMMTRKKSRAQRAALIGSTLMVVFAAASIGWTAVVIPQNINKEEVFEKVEKMPHFPGCDASKMTEDELKICSFKLLVEFMGKTVKYPKKAESGNVEGTVMVKFIVSSDGDIEKAKVVKNVSDELDAEALRVINAMPNWVPGEKEGKKVNVSMVLPIKFQLS